MRSTILPACAVLCTTLSVDTLVEAHRRGIFTFAHFGPLKWMAPPERCVLSFADFHMSKRLRSRLRQNRFHVTFDRDFEGVIKACAGRRDGKWHLTWITPQIMRAYCDLHDAGYAHSFEVWNGDGALVGGGYGVAVGGAFTIESQFTRESHTSKIGFAMLNWHLAKWGFLLNDNKGPTRNTLEMGFEVVPRADVSGAPRRGDAAAGPARQVGGRNRPGDRGAMAAVVGRGLRAAAAAGDQADRAGRRAAGADGRRDRQRAPGAGGSLLRDALGSKP